MELIKVDPKDYGIESSKAQEIKAVFDPMIKRLVKHEKDYNKIAKMKAGDDKVQAARKLRLSMVKDRGIVKRDHKEQKEFYRQGGLFVDGLKNTYTFGSSDIEAELMKIEKEAERLEAERISNLQIDRASELTNYMEEHRIPDFLGSMTTEFWNTYLGGVKVEHQEKIDEEEKIEKARIAQEKKDVAERLKIEKENKKLKAEKKKKDALDKVVKLEMKRRTKEMQPYTVFIKDYADMLTMDLKAYTTEINDVIKGANAHWDFERKEKIRKDKEEKAAKATLKKEQDARKKLEDEARAAAQLEEDRLRKIALDKEAKLNMGDAEKVKELIFVFTEITAGYSFKSKKNKAMFKGVCVMLGKVINYIQSK